MGPPSELSQQLMAWVASVEATEMVEAEPWMGDGMRRPHGTPNRRSVRFFQLAVPCWEANQAPSPPGGFSA